MWREGEVSVWGRCGGGGGGGGVGAGRERGGGMRAGGGRVGEGGLFGSNGTQSGHGPKGQPPIHVKVAGGGRAGIAREAYLKAVVFEAGNEKEWTTKLVILQIRPVTSSLFPLHA